jgi:hypothetical protein
MLARWLAVGILGFMIGAATIVLADSKDDTQSVVTPVAATSGSSGTSLASEHAGHSGVVIENGQQISGVKALDIAAEALPDQALDPSTRDLLAAQLVAAREAAARYPTVADVEAAGWSLAGGFSPLSGAHYVSGPAPLTGSSDIDAGHPDTYIYDGTSPTSRIVGLMYNALTGEAPEGFAGPNDHWHRHSNVCLRYTGGKIEVPFPADSDVTAKECAGQGGRLMPITTWMVHAWVVPGWESPEGVFSHNHANMRCGDGTLNTDKVGFCAGS